jgi:hypothetical protein
VSKKPIPESTTATALANQTEPVRFVGRNKPLPDDYEKLSSEVKRVCRINAIRCNYAPEDYTRGWGFFRSYYLASTRKRELPSPPLHYQWIYTCAKYARNLIAAPRSFAKSTVVGKEYPLYLALSQPGIDILVITSTGTIAKQRGRWFMNALTEQRIADDFGDQKGRLRDGNRMWNYTNVHLANGSTISVMGLGSIHLGARPDIIIMDDVEPDPQTVKDWERIVNDLHSAIFDVFLPMLDAGTSFVMIGTLLHRRSFLYWAMTTGDKRLKFFHRTLSAIQDRDGVPTWPEKFNRTVIGRLKQELGFSAFMAQFMNEPTSGEDCILKMHNRVNGYTVSNMDGPPESPFASNELVFDSVPTVPKPDPDNANDWEERVRPFASVAEKMYRFITVDYAEGTTDQHDYSVIHVMGDDETDTLWSLECQAMRTSPEKLVTACWALAAKWRVKLIGIEAIGPYKVAFDIANARRPELEKMMGTLPRLVQIKYPAHLSKESRISGLEWRFSAGRVRIPDYDTPSFKMLRYQIEHFTPDGKNLRHDDCIDTLAMHQALLRPKHGRMGSEKQEVLKTLAYRLVNEGQFDPTTGVPYASGLSPTEVPFHQLREKELDRRDKEQRAAENRRERRLSRDAVGSRRAERRNEEDLKKAMSQLPLIWDITDLARRFGSHD